MTVLEHICPKCGCYVKVDLRIEPETVSVLGESITAMSNIAYCHECGHSMWIDELDNANLQRFYDIYRKNHNMMPPYEIKQAREALGLTQVELGNLSGLGEKRIKSLERGGVAPVQEYERLMATIRNDE